MEKIFYIDTVIDKKTNYDESIDAIVPDLYPDISKIVGVTAYPYIKDVAVQNDRVLISGDLQCDVCYIEEGGGNPIILKIALSFAHIEQGALEELSVNCSINLNKIEARVANPRKISILASVCISTKAYKECNMNIQALENDDFQILPYEQNLNLIDSLNLHEFSISDNIEFKSILASEYELYGLKPKIVINDTKILKNKLMLRGNIEFLSTLIEEQQMSEISSIIPFSQILDININDESLETFVDTQIKSFEYENITGTEYSFNIEVKTCIIQSKVVKIPQVVDIYDTKNEILVNSVKHTVLDTPNFEFEKADFGVNIISENIIDNIMHIECQSFSKINQDNTYNCIARVTGIYKSGNDFFDFEHEQVFLECQSYSEIICKNIEITKIQSNELNFHILIDLYKYNSRRVEIEMIESVTRGEALSKISNTLILKYISQKTQIWDIAKKYNTTVKDIIASNYLEPDTKEISNAMILIPV